MRVWLSRQIWPNSELKKDAAMFRILLVVATVFVYSTVTHYYWFSFDWASIALQTVMATATAEFVLWRIRCRNKAAPSTRDEKSQSDR